MTDATNVNVYLQNSTPQSIHVGTRDWSGRPQPIIDIPRAMHLPYIPIFSEKGPVDEQLVDGNAFETMFGSRTLNPTDKFMNHSSVFLDRVLKDGGQAIVKRIVPEGADKLANLRVSIEYFETEVDLLERDDSGFFKKDRQGEYIKTGVKAPGINYRFVTTPIEYTTLNVGGSNVTSFDFGKGAESESATFRGESGEVGKRVPLFDLAVSSPGSWGNLMGIMMWAPTELSNSPINQNALRETKSYPFRLMVMSKPTPTGSARGMVNRRGLRELDFSLNPSAVSKAGLAYGLGEVFVPAYNDLYPESPTMPPTYGAFSRLHIYQDNIDKLLDLFYTKEYNARGSAVGSVNDFSGLEEEPMEVKRYLFNLLGGTYSDGTPYQTYRRTNTVNALPSDEQVATMLEGQVLWASGGIDGEMNDEVFAKAVDTILDEFADPNSKYQDSAQFNDSTFWDTGYPLDFKLKLGRYLAHRKDRWVCATTYIAGEPIPSPVEENAILTAIVSRLKLYPDSTLFGTPCYRGIVIKGSGRFKSSVSNYRQRVPISYEWCGIVGKYWGAGNGKANQRYDYTEGDNNFVKYLTDISTNWVPFAIRNAAWAAGGNWVERSEKGIWYFNALRTIYEDESSTLTSPRVMLAHVEVNKIGAELQRRFSGKDWSQERFIQEGEAWFYDQLKDKKFGGKIGVRGKMWFDAVDNARGWSWHFKVEIYGEHIKTVQLMFTENFRRSDAEDTFTGVVA